MKPESATKSGYKVIWTDRALHDLDQKIDWLTENWTDKEIAAFGRALEERVALIQSRPQLFPLTLKRRNVRKSIMRNHTVLYYKTVRKNLYILSLFDPRQNPGKAQF